MPKITNRVLTSPAQGLSEEQKRNARQNIGAMQRTPFPAGAEDKLFVLTAQGGDDSWEELLLVDDPVPENG